MIQTYYEEQILNLRKNVGNIFLLAEVVTRFIARDEKQDVPHPWEYYPEIFAEDKKLYEEKKKQEELESYKDMRRAYVERWNRNINQ